LAETLAKIIDYQGELIFDINKPDGTPRKLMDVSKINTMGWRSKIGLVDGLNKTIAEYRLTLKPNNSIK
jgi:GDP-L-fucose synthase